MKLSLEIIAKIQQLEKSKTLFVIYSVRVGENDSPFVFVN